MVLLEQCGDPFAIRREPKVTATVEVRVESVKIIFRNIRVVEDQLVWMLLLLDQSRVEPHGVLGATAKEDGDQWW